METQRDSTSLERWSLLLLLLGLVITPATSRTLSYREAVLRVVDGINQRSSEENLYRLLKLDSQPQGDKNPNIPKPVSFTVKETVCPKTTQQPLEQCDFKDNGLVKQCYGTVILDSDRRYFDINCDEVLENRFGQLRDLIRRGGQKIAEKFQRIGEQINDIFRNLQAKEES
ncbi:PREDICTED: cathelicidin antimicrobial peptide [Odobenus rosmarus divergens]|uniref:Cathelicidin antimicrobial peptide n=1 Tax=Odobenus rosmarus divergens TaxID=9708 RepID=A0A2U3VV05_ODORO|nr:PREDICTED: cathelicidin antimicrobial peptide [Odobenus rosmarus divergens]